MIPVIIGGLITYVGFLMVSKTEWLIENFGRIGFFEQYLSSEGGSRLGYKLVGILGVFIGILTITGLWDNLLGWVLFPLTSHMQPLME